MKTYAVTVSSGKILTLRATGSVHARSKAQAAITERGLTLTVDSVRLITGRI